MTERRLAQIAWLARLALALVFIWHGLAPKVLWLSPDEVAMIAAHGLPDHPLFAPQLIAAAGGIAEILLGILLLGPCWSLARCCWCYCLMLRC